MFCVYRKHEIRPVARGAWLVEAAGFPPQLDPKSECAKPQPNFLAATD
jgi:hypothetical protein